MSVNVYDKITNTLKKTAGRVADTYTKNEVDKKMLDAAFNISDEWLRGKSYAVGSYSIDDNKLYKCVGSGGGNVQPSTDTGHTVWMLTNVDAEFSELNSNLDIAKADIKASAMFKSLVFNVTTKPYWLVTLPATSAILLVGRYICERVYIYEGGYEHTAIIPSSNITLEFQSGKTFKITTNANTAISVIAPYGTKFE